MESKNRLQGKITERNNLKTKLLVIGITALGAFVLSGCQEQMASIRSLDLKYPVIVNEKTAEPISVQFASKATFIDSPLRSNTETDHKNIRTSAFEIIASRYQNTPVINLKAGESWKETYEGKGVPILKISF